MTIEVLSSRILTVQLYPRICPLWSLARLFPFFLRSCVAFKREQLGRFPNVEHAIAQTHESFPQSPTPRPRNDHYHDLPSPHYHRSNTLHADTAKLAFKQLGRCMSIASNRLSVVQRHLSSAPSNKIMSEYGTRVIGVSRAMKQAGF